MRLFISKVITTAFVVILLLVARSPRHHRLKPPPQPKTGTQVSGFLFKTFDLVTPKNDHYKYAVSIRHEDNDLLATGVLISNKFVLTAGHVTEVLDTHPANYYIHYNDNGKRKRVKIDTFWTHPDYSQSVFGLRNDLGIIKLCKPITTIIPAKLNTEKYFLMFRKNNPITTIGFSFNFKKSSRKDIFRYYGTLETEPGNMKFLGYKGHIWYGDSGGPVVMNDRVVGIMSSFLVIDNIVIENSAVRVDRYAKWITNTMLCGGN